MSQTAVLCSHAETCDKYLFTLWIILGADIMHFAVPSPQTPGMHQHLYPLNTFSFFVSPYSLSFSLPWRFRGAFFGTNDTVKRRRSMATVLWGTSPKSDKKKLISIILRTPRRRLKWWSAKHSSHCMFSLFVCSLENCIHSVSQLWGRNANHNHTLSCYLLSVL